MRVATWNCEWAPTKSPNGQEIRKRLRAVEPEIVVLTEAQDDFLSEWGGYSLPAVHHEVHPLKPSRRKVVLWSQKPWERVDLQGSPSLRSGYFVQGWTSAGSGPVEVTGLVIPYHMTDVKHGSRRARPWEEHAHFLAALAPLLAGLPDRAIVLGDFNQRIPSTWVPRSMRIALAEAFQNLQILTGGTQGPDGGQTIDHIAVGAGLMAEKIGTLSNKLRSGSDLTDHFGVWAEIAEASECSA